MAEKPVVDEIDVETTLAEIEQARQRLGAALAQLRQRDVMNPLNIRAWVQRHPIESALGAAAAGFILAQPGGRSKDGESPSLLSDLSRSGIESMLPFLLKSLF
jgi:hypothetical protein